MDEIRFYRADEKPYGAFSNLFRRPVVFEGREFATAEHAFQFAKPRRPEVAEWLMGAPSPSILAASAHALLTYDVAPNWSDVRRPRMRAVAAAKFAQHEDLAALLLGTGGARIVETPTLNSPVNRRWGEVNGRGENWLGIILMEVRGDLGGVGVVERAETLERTAS